ncbi:protein transporter tim10 [Balamuthia mandrillaris]
MEWLKGVFGLGEEPREGPSQAQLDFMAAQYEAMFIQKMYDRLSVTCWEKCINKDFVEEELNLGEKLCTERCTRKYVQVHNIGRRIMQRGPQQQQQQQKSFLQQQTQSL